MAQFDIWMEGYSATGYSKRAQKVNKDPIEAENFDEAVKWYMDTHPRSLIEPNARSRYISDEHYAKRRSSWNIWGCNLFADEAEARKSFG